MLIFFSVSALNAQSREGLIQLEFKNYVSLETRGQVTGEGNFHEGKKHGQWDYYLIFDRNIKYYSGFYEHGKKSGVWNNYALIPPMGYKNNHDLKRSTETWKNGRLYRFKMGQDNMLITIKNGLEDPYVAEIRRLDEAFENSYRRTHGKTVTPEFGESVESIQSRMVPMIRQELLKSKQRSSLKFWSLYGKLRLHEEYDSGQLVRSIVQNWDKTVLFSREVYEKEVLTEKTIFLNGDPSNFIDYIYSADGSLLSMKQYVQDSIPSGRWIENYNDGSKKSLGSYSGGKKTGKWKYWDEEGELETVRYRNGVPAEK